MGEIALRVWNSLAPVFGVILLGAILRKTRFYSEQFITGLSKLVYWVAIPSLLFISIAQADYSGTAAGKIFLVLLIGMGACIVVGYLVARVARCESHATGTFVQAAFRGNLVYIGLAVIIYSYGKDKAGLAMLAVAPLIVLYNVVAVIVLLGGRHMGQKGMIAKVLKGIVTNPLIIACLLGLVFNHLNWSVPVAIERTASAVGQIAMPSALLCIGGTLMGMQISGSAFQATLAALVKVAFAPLVGLVAAKLIGLNVMETQIALVFLAAPTAVTSHIVAERLGGDRSLSASAVAIASVLSFVSLAVVVALA